MEGKQDQQQKKIEVVPIKATVILDENALEKIKVGNSEVITISVKSSYIHPYKTFPSEGENQVSDYDQAYAYALDSLEKEFERFPDCCEGHRKLSLEKWFNKEDFKEVPKLTADKIFYTYNHILNYIKEENWEQEIKDYLDYTLESFGHFPIGLGGPVLLTLYLVHIEHILAIMEKSEEYCFPVRIKVIREYIDQKTTPVEKAFDSDISLLLKTYNKWYEIFPFELSYLQPVKEKLSRSIPILRSFHANKYSGKTIYIPLTKTDLINQLIKTTNKILTEFNLLYLYKNNLITNYSQLKLELIIKERELQLQKGYISNPEDETSEYYQMLNQWFSDEVSFITNISSLFTEEAQNKKEFQNFDQEIGRLRAKENLFWKGIPMEVAIDHFIKLTTHKNKKREPYLTQSQFISFIKRSFLQQNQEAKQTLNIGNSENGAVIKLFYQFFDLAVAGYGEKSKNEKYIRLVLDNFTNWDTFSQVKSLFRKDKSSKIW
jgi:hypothetical protein